MRLPVIADAAGNLAIVVALAAIVLLFWLVGRVARLASDVLEVRRIIEDLLGATRGPAAGGEHGPAASGDEAAAPEEPPAPSHPPEALSSEPQLAGGHRMVREADAAPTDPWTCKDCDFTSNSRAAARAHRIATGARSLVPRAAASDQGSAPE